MYGRCGSWWRGGMATPFMGGGFPWGRGGRWGRFFGPGEIRLALLSMLESGSKHGYELMKELETKSGGIYKASAGAIYPALQQLEDEGLVTSDTATILEVIAPGGLEQAFREAGWDLRTPLPDGWACMPDTVAAAMAKVGCTILGPPPDSPSDDPIAALGRP